MSHAARLIHRIVRLGLLTMCALCLLQPAASLAAPGIPTSQTTARAADSDGDGIADDFDPDDDNDGVTDDREGNGANPGPGILDPGTDSDGDGITNVLDPDDNNNAVTDEEDPAPIAPPSGGGGPSNPPSSGSSEPPPAAAPATSSSSNQPGGVLVRALPETGTGPQLAGSILTTVFTASAILLSIVTGVWTRSVRTE